MNRRSGLILLSLGWLAPPVFSAEPLRHDPFARPAFAQAGAGGATVMRAGNGDELMNWAPQISLLMKAGRDSMAVVNGSVIRLGESVDGYRLVLVRQDEAVFMKNGKRMAIQLKPSAISKIDKESKQ